MSKRHLSVLALALALAACQGGGSNDTGTVATTTATSATGDAAASGGEGGLLGRASSLAGSGGVQEQATTQCTGALNGQSAATKAATASALKLPSLADYANTVCGRAIDGVKAGKIGMSDLQSLMQGQPSQAVIGLFNPMAS